MKKILSVFIVLAIALPVCRADAAFIHREGYINLAALYGIPKIANRDNNLPASYVPELVSVPNTHFQLEKETLDAYNELLAAARKAGHNKLKLQSAYRSYETQRVLHNNKKAQYAQYGAAAGNIAARVVARPGQSEHQLGNTIDIADNGRLIQSFGKTSAGIWLAENAHLYGFILRYPENKTDITGVVYEPWHFRYVGVGLAEYIYKNRLTLEEYYELALGSNS